MELVEGKVVWWLGRERNLRNGIDLRILEIGVNGILVLMLLLVCVWDEEYIKQLNQIKLE